MLNYIKKISNASGVVIHSDLISFGKKILDDKKKLRRFLIHHFNNGLYIPSFYLKSKKTVRFDKFEHTMGSLTNIFKNFKKCKRIINPIHSYLCLNSNININSFKNISFGQNSIFDYFCKNKMTWVNLGADNNSGFTIFHHAEDLANVNYRKRISFKRKIYISKNKILSINYFYFSRKKIIKYDFNKVVKKMLYKKILKSIKIKNGKNITYGKCHEIVQYLYRNLKRDNSFLIKK